MKSQIYAGGRGLGTFTNGLKGGVHICTVNKVRQTAAARTTAAAAVAAAAAGLAAAAAKHKAVGSTGSKGGWGAPGLEEGKGGVCQAQEPCSSLSWTVRV